MVPLSDVARYQGGIELGELLGIEWADLRRVPGHVAPVHLAQHMSPTSDWSDTVVKKPRSTKTLTPGAPASRSATTARFASICRTSREASPGRPGDQAERGDRPLDAADGVGGRAIDEGFRYGARGLRDQLVVRRRGRDDQVRLQPLQLGDPERAVPSDRRPGDLWTCARSTKICWTFGAITAMRLTGVRTTSALPPLGEATVTG